VKSFLQSISFGLNMCLRMLTNPNSKDVFSLLSHFPNGMRIADLNKILPLVQDESAVKDRINANDLEDLDNLSDISLVTEVDDLDAETALLEL
jgi:hypothetical protein